MSASYIPREGLKESFASTLSISEWFFDHYRKAIENYNHSAARKHSLPLLDFTFGNPHDILPGFVDILQQCAVPPANLTLHQKQTYYEYQSQKTFIKERKCIADRLNDESPITNNMKWSEDNILLTTGAYAGLYTSIATFVTKNDEVIYFLPHWFRYNAMITANYGVPRPINIENTIGDANNMNLIKNYIEPCINSSTKLFIFNTPHNPSGITFNEQELVILSNIFERKSKQFGQRIWIMSDESYRDYIYDNKQYLSITQYYPYSVVVYTYGKITLAPAQRIGWMGISPLMQYMDIGVYNKVNKYLVHMVRLCGFQVPSIVPGKGLIEIERLIDRLKKENGLIKEYEMKRDLIYDTVKNRLYKGYAIGVKPSGTFYLLVKLPKEYNMDGFAFCKEFIKMKNVLILPGYTFGLNKWIRITYTAPMWKVKQFCQRLVEFDGYLQANILRREASKL